MIVPPFSVPLLYVSTAKPMTGRPTYDSAVVTGPPPIGVTVALLSSSTCGPKLLKSAPGWNVKFRFAQPFWKFVSMLRRFVDARTFDELNVRTLASQHSVFGALGSGGEKPTCACTVRSSRSYSVAETSSHAPVPSGAKLRWNR